MAIQVSKKFLCVQCYGDPRKSSRAKRLCDKSVVTLDNLGCRTDMCPILAEMAHEGRASA
jgi:hypothetical protein